MKERGLMPLLPRWDEWSEWHECSVTCGNGTASRVRICYEGDETSNECDGVGVEVKNCSMPKCTTRINVVKNTISGKCSKFCSNITFEILLFFRFKSHLLGWKIQKIPGFNLILIIPAHFVTSSKRSGVNFS